MSNNKSIANLIIDNLDFSKIYKTTIESRIIEEKRNILLQQLELVNCKRIYDSFINAGINESDIPGYIVNLLIDNGFKGYSLEELSKLDNLGEIILKNIKNLKCRVQAIKLDRLVGIDDNSYEIQGTGIKLRDYQYNTLKKIDEIFETKRFAGMILPTGAGKSFVAMSEMMKFKNSNIVFIAPQKAILLQFQKHIVKHILRKEDVPLKDLSKTVEEAFPYLKMFCYDTIATREQEWIKRLDADLIILDELHRVGAETWKPKTKELIELNPNAKILGMTATPIRDMDHRDMMREVAEMADDRTIKELKQKKYLASEMYLLDAMRDGIVVCPKIVTFDYSLEDSQEYKEVKRMIEEETNSSRKQQLKDVYNRMTDIIEESKKEGIGKIILNNIKKKDGRYIVFLPRNSDSYLYSSSEEYMKAKIDEVKEYFKEVDPNPEISFLLSDRKDKKENLKALDNFESSNSKHLKLVFAIDMLNEGVHIDKIDGAVMLRPISDNSKILYLQQIGRCIFSIDPDNPINEEDIPIIFDVYNNYLAQDIDREINKTNSTSDLERLQLVVNWINKHRGYIPDINSEDKTEAKKAIILKNIQTRYKKYREGINNNNLNESEIYEIERIIELGNIIDLWNLEIPDRDVKSEEKEIIRNNTFTATGTQKEFMDLFKEVKQIKRNRKLTNRLRLRDTMSILDVLNEYGIEINNETINKNTKLKDVIKDLPIEIQKEILNEVEVGKEFVIGEEYNFAKQAFFNGYRFFTEYDVRELRKYGIFEPFIHEKKNIKLQSVKGEFIICGHNEFKNINIKTGTIYDEEGYDKDGYNNEGYDREGYNRLGYDIHNFYKGETYNIYGFDRRKIHKETGTIYDKYGFKADKTYKETGNFYDPRGFNIDRKNKETGTIYDNHGYDIDEMDKEGFPKESIGKIRINKYGFDKNGYYYEKREDETYEPTGLKYNKYGFMADKKHAITKMLIDIRRFDIEGKCKGNNDSIYDKNGFRQDGTYKDTGEYYNNGYNAFGVDCNGKLRNGKIHPDILLAKEYIEATYHGKRNELVRKYGDYRTAEERINTTVYTACQMYPKMKEYICNTVISLEKAIRKREERLDELKKELTSKREEIEKLEKSNEILKKRLSNISNITLEIDK